MQLRHTWAVKTRKGNPMPVESDPKQETPVPSTPTPPNANGGGQEPGSAGDEKRFTQAELNAKIAERLEQDKARRKRETDEAEAERERKEAEKRGEWETVNKALADEIVKLKAERDALTTKQMQIRVATDVGLPLQLADRIKGDTEDEMADDAKAILSLMPKAESVAVKVPVQGSKDNPPPKGSAASAESDRAAVAAQGRIYSRI